MDAIIKLYEGGAYRLNYLGIPYTGAVKDLEEIKASRRNGKCLSEEERRRCMIGRQQGDSICARAEYHQSPSQTTGRAYTTEALILFIIPFQFMSIVSLNT